MEQQQAVGLGHSQEEAEDATLNQAAEEEALRAVEQQAQAQDAEIPRVRDGEALAAASTGSQRRASASEAAMGKEVVPGQGQTKSEAASETAAETTAETATAAQPAPAPKEAVAKAAGGPWTAESIATVVANKSAGGVMQTIAANDTQNGVNLLKSAKAWQKILDGLPRGDALAAPTKAALYQLIVKQAVTLDDAKKLFDIRFKHPLTETSGTWTMTNIRIVWHQLDALPEQDVSENTIVTAYIAIAGGGGFGPSWEAPETINTIQLGEDSSAEHLPHTVRHEVGHGVHAQIPSPINTWLQSDMSFWFTNADDAGLESWIQGLGGYPDKYTDPDGNERAFDDTAKAWIKHMIKRFTGSGSWDPARDTPDQGEAAINQAMWAAMPEAVKNACAQSTSYWYSNWRNFQQGTDGKRYFLNHWYHRPFTIGPVAQQAIEATGDDYTAMSEKEFFANCYAEYFKDPQGVKDATKWGGSLPSAVKDFFTICVVQRHPYNKFQQSQKQKNT